MKRLEPIRVVIIDDDDTYFNILKIKFDKIGFELYWAQNLESSFEIIKKYKPTLVITDIVLAKGNGFEIIKLLKSRPETSNILFVILSDWGETRLVYDKDFLDSLGIARYLVKSNYTPTEVFNEVKKILNK